jgi:hypothetical protein
MQRLAIALGTLGACGGGASVPPDAAPPYTIPAFDHQHLGSHSDQPDFQTAHAQIDLGTAPVAKATLVIDLESPCFPFDKWQADRPPSGQNWPADCDAFDRNFEFTLDGDLELARLITPFGGPLHEEIDVTDAANALHGPHDLQAFIATWSDNAGMVSGSNGGWLVSAHVDVVPGPPPRTVLAVVSLADGSITTAAPLAPVGFDVPEGVTSARLEYRATGHGGATESSAACIGPAEEFCKRTQHVTVDGVELDPGLVPWRTDCASLCTHATYTFPGGQPFTYCKENPCGAIQSVDAPRANWCPGSQTPPKTYDADALHAAGHHTFAATVDGENAGGTWRVSATLYLFGATSSQ